LSPSARARIPGLSLNVKSKGLRPRWADLCGLFAAFRVPGVGGAVAGQHCQQSRRCSRSSLRTPKNVIEVAPRRRPGHPNRPTFPSEPLRGAGNDALRQRSYLALSTLFSPAVAFWSSDQLLALWIVEINPCDMQATNPPVAADDRRQHRRAAMHRFSGHVERHVSRAPQSSHRRQFELPEMQIILDWCPADRQGPSPDRKQGSTFPLAAFLFPRL
jgi:hypothetical protein